MKKIEIYTSDTCHRCHEAKKYFEINKLQYIEHNVSKDTKARQELIRKGYMSVPVIMIENEEVLGFDLERIEHLLQK